MVFIANMPQATQKLKDSQPQLLGNNIQLDASFGVDHYTFSNGTSDNGKHNQVTTPKVVGAVHPTTAVGDTKFYCMQDSSRTGLDIQSGLMQYSRGPSDATPTPLTNLYSIGNVPIANGATIDIFNFGSPTVIPVCSGVVTTYSTTIVSRRVIYFFWNGTTLVFNTLIALTSLLIQASGSIMQIFNNTGGALNIYWSIEFQRFQ